MSVRTRAADPGLSDRRAAAFTPYVRAGDDLAELTPLAIALGIVLSLTFGMVNAYLGLKIGLTVSASIPSAVLSMTVLRGILRRGTVLENNVVHAIASTGESLAAGVIFTIPALIFLDQHPSALEVFLIAVGAGTLGILLMIPFRHDLTVEEHATLPFPEGTACARVLMAGDRGGVTARPVFAGIALGALYQLAMRGFSLWRESVSVTLHRFHKATFGMELSPLFLGVGFLIGPRIAGTMLAGGVLGWTVLLPWFDKIGGSGVGAMLGIPETVRQLGANDIWSRYVRYVGAGAVAAGGISAVVRALPVMLAAFTRLRPANRIAASALPRTERGAAGITACITVGALVAISIALAGDLAQDLKTGALLGATPYRLQIGQMIGVTAAALRAGSVLLLLHAAYGLGSPALPAPQAKLMATLVTGVMDGNLPWTLMALGAGLALTAELCGLIPLAFAIGLYLPITTTAPLILGGLLRAFLSREATPLDDRPVLFASGLIAGDALMGIGIAALTVGGVTSALALRAPGTAGEATEAALTILPFASLAVVLARYARGAERQN